MKDFNICRFVPFKKTTDRAIRIINFVLETNPQIYEKLKIESIYKIHIVTEGKGIFHTAGKVTEAKKGDVFFTFPAMPYAIESKNNFKFMYISFLGEKAYQMLDRLGINNNNFVFRNQAQLLPLWNDGIMADPEFIDLSGEGILIYTLSALGSFTQKNSRIAPGNAAALIKKYIDDNFSDPNLSIKRISDELSYSGKYISSVFKKQMKTGISEYLSTVRIKHACTLLEQNFSCVKDVAYLCGFSDPAYFSRVFKEKMGVSPKAYL